MKFSTAEKIFRLIKKVMQEEDNSDKVAYNLYKNKNRLKNLGKYEGYELKHKNCSIKYERNNFVILEIKFK